MERKRVRCRVLVVQISGLMLGLSVFVLPVRAQHQPAALAHDPGSQAAGLQLPAARPTTPNPAARARVMTNYGKLPLAFEANQGQTDRQVKFLARGAGYLLFLTGDEAVLSLREPSASTPLPRANEGRIGAARSENRKLKMGARRLARVTGHVPLTAQTVVQMKLMGANPKAAVAGLEELPGKSNYFIGNNPKQWRTDVPSYARVRYQKVYPGIDLVYYGHQGRLEYDFVVAPGADPAAIRLGFGVRQFAAALPEGGIPGGQTSRSQSPQQARASESGSKPLHAAGHHPGSPLLRLAANGDLVMQLASGEIRFHKPVVYQSAAAASSPAIAEQGPCPAKAGLYESLPPCTAAASTANRPSSLVHRKYLDGRYVLEANNQVTFAVSSYDRSQPLIIDPVLVYSSYIGGTGFDQANGIALDGSGNAYVTGVTASTDFPVVNQISGACNGTCGTGHKGVAFVTKVNAAGNALVYSSFIGGSGGDQGAAVAVDGAGDAYLTGLTNSTDFPRVNQISGACDGTCGSGSDSVSFVTEINSAGSALVYSSLIGGSGGDQGTAITVDGSDNTYLTGLTNSTDFPRLNQIPGICEGTCGSSGGFPDAFVTEINPAGSALLSSSLLGGSGPDTAYAIAADGSGNVDLTGYTGSADFPRLNQIAGACVGLCGKGSPVVNAFVIQINAGGSALVYSSLVGGSDQDIGRGIAVDGASNVYLTGATDSPDFPRVNQIPGACNGSCGMAGPGNAFVTKVNSTGSALVYSSYVGGSSKDTGYDIAVDGSGNAYLTGATVSTDFPQVNPIPGACKGACGTGAADDTFITEVNAAGSALVYSSYVGGSGTDDGFGIAVDSTGDSYLTGRTNSTDFPQLDPIAGACNGACGTGQNFDAFLTKVSPAGTPIVSLSPSSLTFGPQGVSAPNFPQTVILTNTGQLPLSITSIAVTGSNSGDFLQANNCPLSPNTLGIGDSCTITVVFAPTSAGTLNADVTITDNAPGSPQNVPLTGVGVSGKPGLAAPTGAGYRAAAWARPE